MANKTFQVNGFTVSETPFDKTKKVSQHQDFRAAFNACTTDSERQFLIDHAQELYFMTPEKAKKLVGWK